MPTKYDFLAIGDTMTDAFVKLKQAEVSCKNGSGEDCTLSMPFKDKIPYEEHYVIPAVGNSANAAVAAARLGLKSAILTNLGDDHYGHESAKTFSEENVSSEFIKLHSGKKTNYHYVLWYDNDRTILIKHEEYPYELPDIGEPSWIYLSSLGESAVGFHDVIADYLESHQSVKMAFQPGTFQIKAGKDVLRRIYSETDIFFSNKEEAERILGVSDGEIKDLCLGLRELGPKLVVITDGPSGAYAYDGSELWMTTKYPDIAPPYERTGAGDAFSSTFTAATVLGMSVDEALRWAPVNSMSVVQKVGARAGLLTREELNDYLNKAPAEFIQTKLE